MKIKTGKNSPLFKIGILLFLSFILEFHCARLTLDVEPDERAQYESIKLGVQVKNPNTNQSQGFKVLFKFNTSGDKMWFLSPLNQVYGLLWVEGEETVLINTKKKKYWQGAFNHLIRWMWGEDMDFQFVEFKKLVVLGEIPQEKTSNKGINITLEKMDAQNRPARILLQSREILVKVKISDRVTGSGKLQFQTDLKGLVKANLDQVME